MSNSESYTPADCCCLDLCDREPCWGQVGLDGDDNICCEGHMGYDYTPEPSAEVANLKAKVERLVDEVECRRKDNAFLKGQRDKAFADCEKTGKEIDTVHRELDMAHRQRHAIASECDRMKVIADAKHRETEILRHERDALIDVQILEGESTGCHFVMSGYNGCVDTRESAVRIVRKRAGLPETEPTT